MQQPAAFLRFHVRLLLALGLFSGGLLRYGRCDDCQLLQRLNVSVNVEWWNIRPYSYLDQGKIKGKVVKFKQIPGKTVVDEISTESVQDEFSD